MPELEVADQTLQIGLETPSDTNTPASDTLDRIAGGTATITLEQVEATRVDLQPGQSTQLQAVVQSTLSYQATVRVYWKLGSTIIASRQDTVAADAQHTVAQTVSYSHLQSLGFGHGQYDLSGTLESGADWSSQSASFSTAITLESTQTGSLTLESASASNYDIKPGGQTTFQASVKNSLSTSVTPTIIWELGGRQVASRSHSIAPGTTADFRSTVSYSHITGAGVSPGVYKLTSGMRSGSSWSAQTVQSTSDVTVEAPSSTGSVTEQSVQASRATLSPGQDTQLQATIQNGENQQITVNVYWQLGSTKVASRQDTISANSTHIVAQTVSYSQLQSLGFGPGQFNLSGTLESGGSWSSQTTSFSSPITLEAAQNGPMTLEHVSATNYDVHSSGQTTFQASIKNSSSTDHSVTVDWTLGGTTVASTTHTVTANSADTLSSTQTYQDITGAGVSAGTYSLAATMHGGSSWQAQSIQSSSRVTIESASSSGGGIPGVNISNLLQNQSVVLAAIGALILILLLRG